MVEQVPTARRLPPHTRRIVQVVLSLVLVVAIFYFLLRGIDLGQVWAEIRGLTWIELATLAASACIQYQVSMSTVPSSRWERWCCQFLTTCFVASSKFGSLVSSWFGGTCSTRA